MSVRGLFLVCGLICAPSAWLAGQPPSQPAEGTKDRASVALAFPPQPGAGESDDPAAEGWDSEALSTKATAQLKLVAHWIESADLDEALARQVVAPGYRAGELGIWELDQVFGGGLLTVRRAAAMAGNAGAESSAGERSGPAGFVESILTLSRRMDQLSDRRAYFKLFKIELEEQSFTTRAYFDVFGRGPNGARQIDSLWTCRWTLPAEGSDPGSIDYKPKLLGVSVSDYEETETRIATSVLFEDATAAAIGHNPSYSEHLSRQPEHWLSRLTKGQGYDKTGWQGISVADVDGDGLEDVFLPDQGGLPNRLFIQKEDGTFDDRSAEAGIDFLERTLAGLFVDLDNDGDPDLVLASRPAVLVLENDGSGHFRNVRWVGGAIPDSHSLSAADYDLDGDLDLYVCAYRRSPDERAIASPIPYHDANNGGRNSLLRNDGGFEFTDVTEEAGLDQNNRRFSLAASWEDFDNDGDADLYVANDYGRNNLYRNEGRSAGGGQVRFTDIAAEAGVEDISSGMSVSWADYNRDGFVDLYVGNMFSAAGNRITYQRRFERDRERAGPLEQVQRMARGNSLFENRGQRVGEGGGFLDRSERAGVNMGRWAWSSLFGDLDNDGWEDIVVANGNLTQTNPDDL